MKAFKSWNSYSKFEWAVKHHSRYIYSDDVEIFLQTVRSSAEKRIDVIPKDGYLWRAQLGHDWIEQEEVGEEIPAPHPQNRMRPLPGRAKEGRANPMGIPYLYLASIRETALAEVRPWIGSQISVAQFKTLKDLKIVNCTTEDNSFKFYLKEPSTKRREKAVWADIDRAFARPMNRTDDVADYAPTQIIAELFKAAGHDGIVYRSSLGKGYNIVIFDIHAAELKNCFLFELVSIDFKFNESATPYFVQR